MAEVKKFLKKINQEYEATTVYLHINEVEYECDFTSDLKEYMVGYDNKNKELIHQSVEEYICSHGVDKMSVEVQVPCVNEMDFTNYLNSEGINYVYYETYLAPDEASRDYSQFEVDVIKYFGELTSLFIGGVIV